MMEPEFENELGGAVEPNGFLQRYLHPYLQPYLQPYLVKIDPNTTYVFSAAFFFLYLAIFVYLIQSATEERVFSNYLMFMGASFTSVLTFLFIITANPIFACISSGSFIGNLLCELFVGTVYYPDQMGLYTGYVHHIVYILIVGVGIRYIDHAAIYNIGSIAEIPSALIAAKRIWKIDSWTYDACNALLFFVLRVLMWVPLWGLGLFIDGASIGEKLSFAALSLGGGYLHLQWVLKMAAKLVTIKPGGDASLDCVV